MDGELTKSLKKSAVLLILFPYTDRILYALSEHSIHVETVVLLSKLDSKNHISVELSMDDMDSTSVESKATYEQIQNHVLQKYDFKVSTLYIAQVKRKYGLEVREQYNI